MILFNVKTNTSVRAYASDDLKQRGRGPDKKNSHGGYFQLSWKNDRKCEWIINWAVSHFPL